MTPKQFAFWLVIITVTVNKIVEMDSAYRIFWLLYSEVSLYAAIKQKEKPQ